MYKNFCHFNYNIFFIIVGKRPCHICGQFRTSKDVTPDGEVHRVLGRSNKIWCPYADDKEVLLQFEKEKKDRTLATWRKANEAKRMKRQTE